MTPPITAPESDWKDGIENTRFELERKLVSAVEECADQIVTLESYKAIIKNMGEIAEEKVQEKTQDDMDMDDGL